MSVPFTVNLNTGVATIVLSTGVHTVNIKSYSGKQVIQAIKDNKSEREVAKMFESTNTLKGYLKNVDRIQVNNGVATIDGKSIPKCLSDRLIKFMENDLPIEHFINFVDRLSANPSYAAVNELYDFLANHDLAITADGCFLAYKSVRGTYKDWHSNSVDNTPGVTIPRMKRNEVDDDRRNHCSNGYHVGAIAYVNNFHSYGGRKIVIVKVDPADVVSVPNDCNCTKCRVCWYEVLKDYTSVLDESPLYTENGDPFECPDYDCDLDFADDLNYDEDNDIYEDEYDYPIPPKIEL